MTQNLQKKISVFTATRAEYGLLYPVLREIQAHSNFELQLIVSGSHLSEGFGKTLSEIEHDGFEIVVKADLPAMSESMSLGAGSLMQTLGNYWAIPDNRPSCLLVLGDRYETLAAVNAAFLSGLPLAHMHGGDVTGSGTLDDPIRHAITKLSHLHFPATKASAERLIRLGEEEWRVTVTGLSSLDNVKLIPQIDKTFYCSEYGLNPNKPWILMTQHSLSVMPEQAGEQARETLSALAQFGEQIEVIVTYPNHDLGGSDIIEQIRQFEFLANFHVLPSLGRERYLNILRYVTVLIGNSSSGLLETAHFKTPCVNIGNRQHGRERGGNVVDVPQDEQAIHTVLARILNDTDYRDSLRQAPNPFGQGNCAQTVVKVFETYLDNPSLLQKQLTY
jgi:GDP/UDP-N,N'-diacetylbacillosamine 2-epimerase (hydrolysing)